MRDEHELSLHAHLFDQFGETADVGFVEWRVHFVQNAEGTGRVLEYSYQQRESGECLLATRKQKHVLQALAWRRGHDVDATLGTVLFVGHLPEGMAPAQHP